MVSWEHCCVCVCVSCITHANSFVISHVIILVLNAIILIVESLDVYLCKGNITNLIGFSPAIVLHSLKWVLKAPCIHWLQVKKTPCLCMFFCLIGSGTGGRYIDSISFFFWLIVLGIFVPFVIKANLLMFIRVTCK